MNLIEVQFKYVEENANDRKLYSVYHTSNFEPGNVGSVLGALQDSTKAIEEARAIVNFIRPGCTEIEIFIAIKRSNGQTIDEFSETTVRSANELLNAMMMV